MRTQVVKFLRSVVYILSSLKFVSWGLCPRCYSWSFFPGRHLSGGIFCQRGPGGVRSQTWLWIVLFNRHLNLWIP